MDVENTIYNKSVRNLWISVSKFTINNFYLIQVVLLSHRIYFSLFPWNGMVTYLLITTSLINTQTTCQDNDNQVTQILMRTLGKYLLTDSGKGLLSITIGKGLIV